MKILQINTSVNSGSTGRIAEDIGKVLLQNGHESFIAYGHNNRPSSSNLIQVGDQWDRRLHGLKSRLFDQHGFGSGKATKDLINRILEIEPDLIHLHNIHGYYINIKVLFDFLNWGDIPVVWTFHDCWPFTGHCTYFDRYACDKWKTECHHCPNLKGYPKSWFVDHSRSNYRQKKALFNRVKNLVIVTPSHWLANHVKQSFLSKNGVKVIHNGIDLNVFKPGCVDDVRMKYKIGPGKIVLGVANVWDRRKGLADFIRLRDKLDASIKILLVGLNREQIGGLPQGITGLARTESVTELASIYSLADVFINPTYIDNFPTTNLEALACGTPVITYNTGGSPESIGEGTGYVVAKGDLDELSFAIGKVLSNGFAYGKSCRERAENMYDKNTRLQDYLEIYTDLVANDVS